MINYKPNIFEYATKELSQDAVFMYLFDCYNSKDSEEKKVGQDFLVLLYKIQGKTIEKEIERVEIKKQYHNIDVLVLVVYKDNSTDYIIIEDKTYSSEHDNQLRRYYKDISDNIDKRTINNIYGVYFKLGMPTKSEIKALDISKDFSYKVLEYPSFLKFLESHKDTNAVIQLIYEFYEDRLCWIKQIDDTDDFSCPKALTFSEVLSDGYAQGKYMSWLMNKVIGADYHEENQYDVMNFGKPCTQYRFVFTEEDENNIDWDCVTNGNISKYCYFFRLDSNSNGWYIAVNQYDYLGDKNWEEKRQVRDDIRASIKEIIHRNNVVDKSDNRGKKESKICLFNVESFENVVDLIPTLREVYETVIKIAVSK